MTFTSIPKARLIELIENLSVQENAVKHFRIASAASIQDRLMAFKKSDLIGFILGPDAVTQLRKLETFFPFLRPPTFYLSIIEEQPKQDALLATSKKLAELQRESGVEFSEKSPVRFVYTPGSAQVLLIQKTHILELKLHYERRFEIIQADPEAEDYGMPTIIYSLETVLLWLPEGNFHHAVLECCDFPAIRPIYSYLKQKMDLDLSPPWLDTEVFKKIIAGADPRSATFTMTTYTDDMNDIQHITLTDPKLGDKGLFGTTAKNPNREQTSGFYSNHPGLKFAGLGVARRDGKVWTPKRLDQEMIAGLALTLIVQTETELAKSSNIPNLLKHYNFHRLKVGDKLLTGRAKETWLELVPLVFSAREHKDKESVMSMGLLKELVTHQNELHLLSVVEYNCDACGVTWLAACPDCGKPLQVAYKGEFYARCESHGVIDADGLVCECGSHLSFVDLITLVRLFPDDALLKSISRIASRINTTFSGFFFVNGRVLKYLPPRKLEKPNTLNLSDFKAWQPIIRLYPSACGPLSDNELMKILSITKEKCLRDGQRASNKRCSTCLSKPLDPSLIRSGKTCLLRLFGIPIGKKFDGVHHGNEIADLLYSDVEIETGKELNLGIHVKSRRRDPPKLGMGRSTRQIRELYTQLLYSAYRARLGDYKIQVLGVAIPNIIHPDVVASWASIVNSL